MTVERESYYASRAMEAMEILAFGPTTAPQIARALQIHPRTARRLLNRMVRDGWLRLHRGAKRTYSPTLRIVALAAQLTARTELLARSGEVLQDLHDKTNTAVHLAIPCYRSALRLARIASRSEHSPAVRDLAPAHAVAAGKQLLAVRDDWRHAVLVSRLHAVTPTTLTDPDALRRDLKRTHERGYAIENDEFRPGVRAIALPVRVADGEVVAALAISSAMLDQQTLLAYRETVAVAANALSAYAASAGHTSASFMRSQ